MKSQPLDTKLLHRAEVKVERMVAVLRVAVAGCLLAAFLILVKGEGADQPYLKIQWLLALLTLLSYFVLGAISY